MDQVLQNGNRDAEETTASANALVEIKKEVILRFRNSEFILLLGHITIVVI